MNKKIVVTIILALLGLCCLCMFIIGGISSYGISTLMGEGQDIKKDVLNEVCNSHGNLSESQFEELFSLKFREVSGIDETKYAVNLTFPSEFDCNTLIPDDFIKLISSRQTLNLTWNNAVQTAQFQFTAEDGSIYEIRFIKEQGKWKMLGMDKT